MSSRIYLDNAATSWPKPESVYRAVDEFQRNLGAAAGRGTYSEAQRSGQLVDRARTALAGWLHTPPESDIVFTFNGTDALNLCLFGLLRPGDHVVTSVIEHNSILRPLAHLKQSRRIDITRVDCDAVGIIRLSDVRAAVTPATRLVAVAHASNVTAAIQPIDEIGVIAHDHGALLLVDAAQSVGHVEIDLAAQPVDLLAASGHKGLLGPLGTGIVYLGPGIGPRLTPFRWGGTGTDSQSESPPLRGPARFEAGNLNVAGIAGLGSGVQYLLDHQDDLRQRDRQYNRWLHAELSGQKQIQWIGPVDPAHRVGLVSFQVSGYDCHEVASILDSTAGIMVRAGLHCAPQIHQRYGIDGSVRASWGPFTTEQHLVHLVKTLTEICAISR